MRQEVTFPYSKMIVAPGKGGKPESEQCGKHPSIQKHHLYYVKNLNPKTISTQSKKTKL